MDVKHIVRVSDERQARRLLDSALDDLVDYLVSSGQQLTDPEYAVIEAHRNVRELERKRRAFAGELQSGL